MQISIDKEIESPEVVAYHREPWGETVPLMTVAQYRAHMAALIKEIES